jgi:hypothetical protein
VSGAQTWTVIGIFAAALFALVGLVVRLVDARIGGLRNELVARLDALDRDVQRFYEHAFGRERSE